MRINHVSVQAVDLEESARFYEQLFGMERIPTAKFRGPVLWLRLGEQQLHLFTSDADALPLGDSVEQAGDAAAATLYTA